MQMRSSVAVKNCSFSPFFECSLLALLSVCVSVCERVSATTNDKRSSRYISFFLIGEYMRSKQHKLLKRAFRCVALFGFYNQRDYVCVCARAPPRILYTHVHV